MGKNTFKRNQVSPVIFTIIVFISHFKGLLCQQNEQQSEFPEDLIYLLPGFSVQSGIKVGQVFVPPPPPVGNETQKEPDVLPVIHDSEIKGNHSEFTICLRFKAFYHRPEYILISAYNYKQTVLSIGVDEVKEQIYFKYLKKSDDSELVARVNFDWVPRLDTWEHICFVKTFVQTSGSILDFYVNGIHKGNETEFPGEITNTTLFLLGQSDPPALATSFSGQISHLYLIDQFLIPEELKEFSKCEGQDIASLYPTSENLRWEEGIWKPIVTPGNGTDIDPNAIPIGMYLDRREVCGSLNDDNGDEETKAMLAVYRMRDMEYHEEICSQLGGKLPDFSKIEEKDRLRYTTNMFLTAHKPRYVQPPPPPPPPEPASGEGEEGENEEELVEAEEEASNIPEIYKTPLNMLSCFVNDELIVWIKDEKAKGKRKSKSKKDDEDTEEEGDCPFVINANGTAVKKCGIDPQACGICLLPKNKANLKMRGLCGKSWLKNHREGETGTGNEEFDVNFSATADKLNGEVEFRGPLGSRIRKEFLTDEEIEDRTGDWILESLVSPWKTDSVAIVKKIPSTKLPVGRHSWEMVTKICQDEIEDAENVPLTLTSCSDKQFTCKTGDCIPLSYRCDSYHDCESGEDEDDCEFLTLDDSYKSQVAPRHSRKGIPWPIYIQVEIVSFPTIVAIEQRLAVDFFLTLRWYDQRLRFHNLKSGSKEENPLKSDTLVNLWIPRLGLLNGLSEFQTIVLEDDAKFYRGYVWRRRKPATTGLENAVEDGIFDGGKNPVILEKEFYQEFTCYFDLTWYPFDRQTCFMNFTIQDQNAKNLILKADSKHVKYLGIEYLVEYTVVSQELFIPELESSANYSTASVSLNFRRRVVYHLLNIFLQSFLLVLTGYMSLFFQVTNFSDRVMVALTVMLVMASLQSSIQDSLPKTAYFKLIDWWILVSLNIQIGLMAFHTFLGMYTVREYRQYKSGMIIAHIRDRRKSYANMAFKNNKDDKEILENLDPDEFHFDDILSAEEFKYPRSRQLNKYVHIGFITLFALFNVIYWSVAAVAYFS